MDHKIFFQEENDVSVPEMLNCHEPAHSTLNYICFGGDNTFGFSVALVLAKVLLNVGDSSVILGKMLGKMPNRSPNPKASLAIGWQHPDSS